MRDIFKLTFTVLLCMFGLSTLTSASSKKGYNIFLKKLQKSCSTTGINSSIKFAFKHTQDEWETIKQAGKFGEEVVKICPNSLGKLEEKYENDLYHFSYEYASDSGNMPNF